MPLVPKEFALNVTNGTLYYDIHHVVVDVEIQAVQKLLFDLHLLWCISI